MRMEFYFITPFCVFNFAAISSTCSMALERVKKGEMGEPHLNSEKLAGLVPALTSLFQICGGGGGGGSNAYLCMTALVAALRRCSWYVIIQRGRTVAGLNPNRFGIFFCRIWFPSSEVETQVARRTRAASMRCGSDHRPILDSKMPGRYLCSTEGEVGCDPLVQKEGRDQQFDGGNKERDQEKVMG